MFIKSETHRSVNDAFIGRAVYRKYCVYRTAFIISVKP